ncbi:hypothetical protein D3C71_2029060 [compost metagenome]
MVLLWQLRHQGIDHALHVGVLFCVAVEGLLGLGFSKGLRAELIQLLLGNATYNLTSPGRRGGGGACAEQQRGNNG